MPAIDVNVSQNDLELMYVDSADVVKEQEKFFRVFHIKMNKWRLWLGGAFIIWAGTLVVSVATWNGMPTIFGSLLTAVGSYQFSSTSRRHRINNPSILPLITPHYHFLLGIVHCQFRRFHNAFYEFMVAATMIGNSKSGSSIRDLGESARSYVFVVAGLRKTQLHNEPVTLGQSTTEATTQVSKPRSQVEEITEGVSNRIASILIPEFQKVMEEDFEKWRPTINVMEIMAELRTISERISQMLPGTETGQASTQPENPDDLTERELEVLRLVAEGRSNKEIAEELIISNHTVTSHMQSLYDKTGVPSGNRVALSIVVHPKFWTHEKVKYHSPEGGSKHGKATFLYARVQGPGGAGVAERGQKPGRSLPAVPP